ncbi:MAG TPA: hypothetical protein VHB79_39185 [Polyangiaceae bacterium]|nr:hypothetical protein [Polyangiaceae bacterium]
MRSLAAAVVLVWLLGCWSRPARGQPVERATTGSALNWSRLPGTETCPDVTELARRIDDHLRREAFTSPAQATLLVDATIEAVQPQGFRVRIILSGAEAEPGVRELESPGVDCSDAVDAAALAIALMMPPDAAAASRPTTTPTTTSEPRQLAVTPTDTALPAKTDNDAPRADSWHTRLAVGALGSVGPLPGASAGLIANLRELRAGASLAIDLSVAYLAPRRASWSPTSGTDFSQQALNLTGVWRRRLDGPLEVSVGAGVQLAGTSARTFGSTASHDFTSLGVSALLEGEGAWHADEHWLLLARLTGGMPVWNESYDVVIDGRNQSVFDPAPVFCSLWLGLGLTL